MSRKKRRQSPDAPVAARGTATPAANAAATPPGVAGDVAVGVRAWLLLSAAGLLAVYLMLAWVTSGHDGWWRIDFVYGNNIFWGDDAYRFFLARSAWLDTDLYWFNFMLPGHVLLDGVLTTLTGGDLLHARFAKAVIATGSLVLLYLACRASSVSRASALVGVALLALMPLYAFVSMSFYGESWFAALVCLAIWLHATGRAPAWQLVVGLLPLVRIEGILFVGSFVLYAMLRRDWRTAMLVLLPGAFYFLLIVSVGPGVDGFLQWRQITTREYAAPGTWYGGDPARFAQLLFLPWILPALAVLLPGGARARWPFLVAALALGGYAVFAVLAEVASFEPRYVAGMFPIIALGFAAAIDRIPALFGGSAGPRAGLAAVVLLVASVFVANASSLFVVQQGWARLTGAEAAGAGGRPLPPMEVTAAQLNDYREVARVVTEMTRVNYDIKTLVVGDVMNFYFLDPSELSPDLRVVFPLSSWGYFMKKFDGTRMVGYYAKPPYGGFIGLGMPQPGSPQVLYLDAMNLGAYPFHWAVRGHDIFLLGERPLAEASPEIR